MTIDPALVFWFFMGGLSVILYPVAIAMVRACYWGVVDSIEMLRFAELKLCSHWVNWLWLIPLAFAGSALETFVDELHGIRRTRIDRHHSHANPAGWR